MRMSFPKRFHPPASNADAKSIRSSHSVNSRTLPGFRTTANQYADDLKSIASRQWKPADTQKIAAHSMFKDAFPQTAKATERTMKELSQADNVSIKAKSKAAENDEFFGKNQSAAWDAKHGQNASQHHHSYS